MKLFDETFDALERKLDLHFRRHMLLTGNIANAETPNYRAREYDFSGELSKALGMDDSQVKKTNPLHMDAGEESGSHVVFDNSGPMAANGNNVDLDLQLGKLGSNERGFANATNFLLIKFRILRTLATGQGGA